MPNMFTVQFKVVQHGYWHIANAQEFVEPIIEIKRHKMFIQAASILYINPFHINVH